MPIELYLAEVGRYVASVFREGSTGSITAAFDRSFYADFDGAFVCFGSRRLGSGALHALWDGKRDTSPASPEVGGRVAISDGALAIDGRPFASLAQLTIWEPAPVGDFNLDSLSFGLAVVDRVWPGVFQRGGLAAFEAGADDGAAGLLRKAALPAIAALKQALDTVLTGGNVGLSERANLVRLIGLGPGLTPSGDDLVAGTLVALHALGFVRAAADLWRIIQPRLHETNAISAAHLRAASHGQAAAALHEAVAATVAGRVGAIPRTIQRLAEHGHTSGSDGFSGVLIALRAILAASSFAKQMSQRELATCHD